MVNPGAAAITAARARARTYVLSHMTSAVRITRGDAAVLGANGVLTADENADVVYAGPARLGPASGPISYTVGDEVQFFSSGTATIPAEHRLDAGLVPTMPQVNDLLEVTRHHDYGYVGRRFRVVDVEASGLLTATRRLQIVGIQRYGGWVDSAVRHPSSGGVPDEIPEEWRV